MDQFLRKSVSLLRVYSEIYALPLHCQSEMSLSHSMFSSEVRLGDLSLVVVAVIVFVVVAVVVVPNWAFFLFLKRCRTLHVSKTKDTSLG